MKKHLFIIFFGLVFMASCIVYVPYPGEEAPPPEEEYYEEPYEEPSPGLDTSYFYDYLSPYGIWVYHPTFRYVWIPHNMPYGWRPYTRGHWIWTDYGWTWRSQVIWGWAPFHYGRWSWSRDLGWFWVPGTVWGPAWVTWRYSDLYIGWAPLPPEARFVVGVGIERLPYSLPPSYWIFVDGNYFMSHSLYLYVFPYERNRTIIRYTVHRTNIYVRKDRIINRGIDVDRVQRIARQKISKHELRDTENAEVRRIRSGELEVYRPTIKKSQVAKPKTVVKREEVKERISEAKSIKKGKMKSPLAEERSLKDAQEREVKLLKESQQKEAERLKQKLEDERKTAESPEAKKKVEKEYKEKIVKLTKSHEEEESQVKKRHEEDKKKVKKKKIKKEEKD